MICLINCGTSWLEEIKDKLNQSFEVVHFKKLEEVNLETYSGFIISGAPIQLTQINIDRFKNVFNVIKIVNVPILGICLGHQFMGFVYDAKLHQGKHIDKQEEIEIIKKDVIFNNIKNKALFREDHSEHIDLPKDFILLAKSKSCDNEVMKHKVKNIYGVQFHPEVSGDNGTKIFRNFLKMCQ